MGPDDSVWEGAYTISNLLFVTEVDANALAGGIYSLRLVFPDTYPEKPPKVRFTCEMFHPNGMRSDTLARGE